MNTIYLLKYNNYYNRIVKREASLSAYQQYQVKYNGQATDPNGMTAVVQGVNFIDNDFVDTQQVVNWGGDIPDYMLVVDGDQTIKSRWFVIKATKTRNGQLLLTLHRDLVVDYYNQAVAAKSFIEKATIGQDNNLIFNSENMTYNQIKQSETLLRDSTEIPWICIYAARFTGGVDDNKQTTTFNLTVDKGQNSVARTFVSIADFNNWVLKKAADAGTAIESDINITGFTYYHSIFRSNKSTISPKYQYDYAPFTRYPTGGSLGSYVRYSEIASAPNVGSIQSEGTYNTTDQTLTWAQIKTASDYLFNSAGATPEFKAAVIKSIGTSVDSDLYSEANNYANSYVRVNQGGGVYKYYKVVVSTPTRINKELAAKMTGTQTPDLKKVFNTFSTNLRSYTTLRGPGNYGYGWSYGQSNAFNLPTIQYYTTQSTVTLQDVTSQFVQQNVNIGAARAHLNDAPYDMFVLPYPVNGKSVKLNNSQVSGWTSVTADAELSFKFANQLLAKYAGDSGSIYDAQILPYCPIVGFDVHKASDGTIQLDLKNSNSELWTPISQSGTTVGYIYHASVSSFSRTIQLENPIVIHDCKIESECDMYRIVSPNYNGVFEFNAAMNGGVSTISIQCTYRPFNPYIKVFPTWGRLYGENFSPDNYDARGLICSGDFSLPVVSSAWETYERQNKNYQAAFDRQIQNMKVNNAIAREQEKWSIIAGTVSAGVGGGAAGLMAGGIPGAIIGGTVGALASGLAGNADRRLNERARQEALDYTKDMYGFRLGNIQALPQSLSRSVAYAVDNKYFPFLEYYTCSEEEKDALRNKLKYNGMTVMTIGTIEEYLLSEPSYIKAKLIRAEDIEASFDIVNALAEELNMGVFI